MRVGVGVATVVDVSHGPSVADLVHFVSFQAPREIIQLCFSIAANVSFCDRKIFRFTAVLSE